MLWGQCRIPREVVGKCWSQTCAPAWQHGELRSPPDPCQGGRGREGLPFSCPDPTPHRPPGPAANPPPRPEPESASGANTEGLAPSSLGSSLSAHVIPTKLLPRGSGPVLHFDCLPWGRSLPSTMNQETPRVRPRAQLFPSPHSLGMSHIPEGTCVSHRQGDLGTPPPLPQLSVSSLVKCGSQTVHVLGDLEGQRMETQCSPP